MFNQDQIFSVLFNSANDAILLNELVDNQPLGNYVEVNEVACKMLEYTKDELLLLSPKDIIIETAYTYTKDLQENIKNNKIKIERTLISKNKKEIPVEIGLSMFEFLNKKWILAIMRDITERKKNELEKEKLISELKIKNEKLNEYSRMKNDFLSIASHDLRSPFLCILSYVDLLLNDKKLDKNQTLYIEMIKRSANVQLQYINDLLDILKFESGDFKLNLNTHNIGEIIKDTVDNFLIIAKQKKIKISIRTNADSIVFIDKPKIMQVLNNLITNAIKFTKIEGEIIIDYFISTNKIEVHIIDNGVGISDDRIDNIFSHFKNNHTDGTLGEAGTGLGLAICKNFIQLHNGEIGVKSKVNYGSDFFFTLPINLK